MRSGKWMTRFSINHSFTHFLNVEHHHTGLRKRSNQEATNERRIEISAPIESANIDVKSNIDGFCENERVWLWEPHAVTERVAKNQPNRMAFP